MWGVRRRNAGPGEPDNRVGYGVIEATIRSGTGGLALVTAQDKLVPAQPASVRAAALEGGSRVEAEPRMDVRDVEKGVAYMASLSLDANVQFMSVMATKMRHIGRG